MGRWKILLVLLLGTGCSSLMPPPRAPLTALPPIAPGTMRLHFIDVGQGDATLLEFPCAAVLVDTGGERNEDLDGAKALVHYLDRFFIQRRDLNRTLDLLLITHPHIDHASGIPLVLSRYTIKNVVDNGQEFGSGGSQQAMLHEYVRSHPGIGHHDVTVEEIPVGGLLTDGVIDPVRCQDVDPLLRVAWGQLKTNPHWSGRRFGKSPYENQNNHSVVLRVDFGKASALLTGDLEEQGIDMMVERLRGTNLLDVDVYKVGHHGSWNGTTEGLVKAMTPEVAVIPVGAEERRHAWTAWKYGHPRANVVDMLLKGVHRKRPPIEAKVADGGTDFRRERIEGAVYATGWDGPVVVELSAEGGVEVRAGTIPGGERPAKATKGPSQKRYLRRDVPPEPAAPPTTDDDVPAGESAY